MKRSRSIVLTSLMAGAGVSISACDNATQWGDGQSARQAQSQAVAYRSLEECKSGGTPADQCEAAYTQAKADNDANAPRFNERQSCEARYGVDQCVPRAQAGGGNVFVPLLAGFMISRALNGGGFGGGMFGAPVYRDRGGGFIGGGSYGGGYGGAYGRSYSGGQPRVGYGGGYQSPSVYAPSRVQSRSAVISRGGFGGGGGRGFGFGG